MARLLSDGEGLAFEVLPTEAGRPPLLGAGSFGTVIRAKHPVTLEIVAVKILRGPDHDAELQIYRGLPPSRCFPIFLGSGSVPLPWIAVQCGPPSLASEIRSRRPEPAGEEAAEVSPRKRPPENLPCTQ
jgi:hypothetical protein